MLLKQQPPRPTLHQKNYFTCKRQNLMDYLFTSPLLTTAASMTSITVIETKAKKIVFYHILDQFWIWGDIHDLGNTYFIFIQNLYKTIYFTLLRLNKKILYIMEIEQKMCINPYSYQIFTTNKNLKNIPRLLHLYKCLWTFKPMTYAIRHLCATFFLVKTTWVFICQNIFKKFNYNKNYDGKLSSAPLDMLLSNKKLIYIWNTSWTSLHLVLQNKMGLNKIIFPRTAISKIFVGH